MLRLLIWTLLPYFSVNCTFLTFFEHSVRCYRSLSPSPPFTGTMESWGAAPFLVQDMKHILHTFFFYKWSMPPKLSFHNKLTLVDHVWFTIFCFYILDKVWGLKLVYTLNFVCSQMKH